MTALVKINSMPPQRSNGGVTSCINAKLKELDPVMGPALEKLSSAQNKVKSSTALRDTEKSKLSKQEELKLSIQKKVDVLPTEPKIKKIARAVAGIVVKVFLTISLITFCFTPKFIQDTRLGYDHTLVGELKRQEQKVKSAEWNHKRMCDVLSQDLKALEVSKKQLKECQKESKSKEYFEAYFEVVKAELDRQDRAVREAFAATTKVEELEGLSQKKLNLALKRTVLDHVEKVVNFRLEQVATLS